MEEEFRVELDEGAGALDGRAELGRSSDSAEVLDEIKATLSRRSSVVDIDFAPDLEVSEMETRTTVSLNNRTRFQRKFYALILGTLRAAGQTSGKERKDILLQLAQNLGARIEPKVISYFLADNSIRLGQRYGNRHYFNLAAEGFGERPGLYDLWRLETIVSSLRSNKVFHEIFALLFHMWIFQPGMADVKSLNLLLSGAETLFLKDLNSKKFVFRPIYQILRRVLANHSMWSESVKAVLMNIWKLYASYSFFYEKEHAYILYNLKQFHLQQLLESAKEKGSSLVLHGASHNNVELNDALVRVILEQMGNVKNEVVLIRYLQFTGEIFKQLSLSPKASLTLQSELYARSKPGNPYYLPDAARRVAATSLATVFPRGRKIRWLIAMIFRGLQPYYAIRSFILYVWMLLMTLLGRASKKKLQ